MGVFIIPVRQPQLLRARAYSSVAQPLPNSSNLALSFDTNVYDNGSIHPTPSQKFTVPTGQGGMWQVWGECVFAGSSSGVRGYGAAINGTINNSDCGSLLNSGTTNFIAISFSDVLELNDGDYVEFVAFQASGAPLNAMAGSFGGMIRLGN